MERALTGTLSLIPSYLYWHYLKASPRIWRHVHTGAWFFWNFFSIGLLTRTFFAPWWREREQTRFTAATLFSIDELADYVSSKLMNGVVLVFGVIVRGVVIGVGLCAEVVLWSGAVIFFVLWLVLPALVMYFLFIGIVFVVRPLPL